MQKLYYKSYGSSQDEAVIFIHGGGLSGTMWQGVAEGLSGLHVLVPDLPRHGQSASIEPLTLAHCLEQLEALIQEETKQGQAHIVGLSLGGAIAISFLKHRPELVKSMIISGTSTRLSKTFAMANNLNAPLYKILPAEMLAKLMIKGFQIPEHFTNVLVEDAKKLTPRTIMETTRILTEIELPLDNQIPLLVLVGENENGVAKRAAKRIVQSVSNSQGYIVPRVGHAWSYQDPSLFAEVVSGWIAGQAHTDLISFN